MATRTFSWTTQGNYTQWTDDWDDWNQDDGDTTYIVSSTDGHKESAYNTDGRGPMGGALINSVTGYNKSRRTGTTDDWRVRQDIRLGGNESSGTPWSPGTSYALNSEVWTSSRPGGGSWEGIDFNTLEMVQVLGLFGGDGTTDALRTTYGYFEVDYDPIENSGFATLLSLWIPPVIAVASHALMTRDIAQILWRLSDQPNRREEFAAIIRAALIRPRFCFLGV